MIRELNFCILGQNSNDSIKDSTLLVRGCNSGVLNKALSAQNLHPDWKKSPKFHLEIDYIYGLHASDRRNSVIYMHFYKDAKNAK